MRFHTLSWVIAFCLTVTTLVAGEVPNYFDDDLASTVDVAPEVFSDSYCGAPCVATCTQGENMIGDGGLLQPRVIVTGSRIFYFQNHISKVSQNNSAMPQDRIGLNFSSLQNVPIGRRFESGPVIDDLQEYRFFAEKTFLDGAASIDLIAPIYKTSESVIGNVSEFLVGPQAHGEFGDLAFGIKGLLHRSERLALSLGLRVEAPTSREPYVALFNARIDDEVWHFTPYLAAQWTPSERVFVNSFLSYRLNSTSMVNTSDAGTALVREATYLMADGSIGYWMIRRPRCRGLTGLASVLELHYTTTPESEPVNALQGISATGLALGHTDYLNLTAGLVARWNERVSVSGAFAFPLRANRIETNNSVLGATDRSYDWAFLLNLNYNF